MSISVIISNFNGARFLPKLIDTLLAQHSADIELIVVDRRSTDGSRELLERRSQVRVIEEPPETGLVCGYAAGAKIANAEHFFFCNEDMWFETDCLSRLEERIDLDRGIVAADPWQWTYDKSAWIHGGTRFRKARWDFNSAYPFRTYDYTIALKEGDRIPFPCAGAFLMHRQAYEEVGGWDTAFFLDHEDTDLFLRVWQRGWSVVTVPLARVYHAVGMANAQTLTTIKQTVNKRRYVSGRASLSIIAFKYNSPAALPMAAVLLLVVLLKDLFRARLRETHINLLAVVEVLTRLPNAWKFRSNNRSWNRRAPGEHFFTDPAFATEPLTARPQTELNSGHSVDIQ